MPRDKLWSILLLVAGALLVSVHAARFPPPGFVIAPHSSSLHSSFPKLTSKEVHDVHNPLELIDPSRVRVKARIPSLERNKDDDIKYVQLYILQEQSKRFI